MDLLFLPLAFGIGSPLMLLWGLAALAPLLIHLLSRRKYREVTWAAMEFLLAAVRKQSRRVWLEQWLLLLLRMAIVLLLVAAWMDLFLDDATVVATSEQRVHRLLVVDGSLSMAAPLGDGTRLDRAKQLAARLVEQHSRPGDRFSLVLLASPARAIVRTPTTDAEFFLAEVKQLPQTHGGAEVEPALQLARDILQRAKQDLPPETRHETFVFTDLQRVTWPADGSGTAPLRWSEQLAALASESPWTIVDVGATGLGNLAITSAALAEPFVIAGRESTIVAQVSNLSDHPAGAVGVELWVNDRKAATQTAALDKPRSQATVALAYPWPAAGDYRVELRLAAPASDLALDNRRWLAVTAQERVRVLCVGGKPRATDYLPYALAPEGPGKSLVEVETATAAVLRGGTDLAAFDALAIVNVGQWSPTEVRRVAAYLDQGGGVLMFLGDQTAVESYNREWTQAAAGATPLLPCALVDIAPPAAYTIDPLEYRHPIAAPFAGQQQGGLATTPIHRYVRLKLPDKSAARVALAVRPTGDPLVVESPARRGTIVLVATDGAQASLDPTSRQPWTYWPIWPSFVPVVQESLRTAVAGKASQRNVLVGEPLVGSATGVFPQTTITVTSPAALTPAPVAQETIRPTHDGERTQWTFDGTAASGIYRTAWNLPTPRSESFAVNVDAAESNLARLDPADLPSAVPVVTNDLPPADRATTTLSRRRGLFEPLLYGALALLLGETLLAWWFGRRAQ